MTEREKRDRTAANELLLMGAELEMLETVKRALREGAEGVAKEYGDLGVEALLKRWRIAAEERVALGEVAMRAPGKKRGGL